MKISKSESISKNIFQVELMMSQSHIHCRCEGSTTPDDLHIGNCLHNLNIPVVNTNRLHQVFYFLNTYVDDESFNKLNHFA